MPFWACGDSGGNATDDAGESSAITADASSSTTTSGTQTTVGTTDPTTDPMTEGLTSATEPTTEGVTSATATSNSTTGGGEVQCDLVCPAGLVPVDGACIAENQCDDCNPCPLPSVEGCTYVSGLNIGSGADDISPLTSLVGVGYFVVSNDALSDLASLRNLHEVENTALFWPSLSLTSLHGLECLRTVGGDLLFLSGNLGTIGPLSDLSGLQSLESVGGDFFLSEAKELTALGGLTKLTAVGGQLLLSNLPVLPDVDELAALQSVGSLFITWSGIESIAGLSGLTTIEGLLQIAHADVIALDGLENVGSVGGPLVLEFNPMLSDVSALMNVQVLGDIVVIRGNPSLPSCDAYALADALIANGFVGTPVVCNNAADVCDPMPSC